MAKSTTYFLMFITIVIALSLLVSFHQVKTGFFTIGGASIIIDGDFSDWSAVLSNPAFVVYDGPWDGLVDLDDPKKPARDLTRFAYTWDDNYLYFYFERVADHEHATPIIYVDADNDGLMEQGEPVIRFRWPKDQKHYRLDIGAYTPANSAGDTMDCGDGCTMPGKGKKVWKHLEKLHGASADYTMLETRIDWDWLNAPINPKCKSCEKIFSLTMQLGEPFDITEPTNVSVYHDHKLIGKYPITPDNTTFTITHIEKPEINVTVDGTNYSEIIPVECNQPIGAGMTFDEFDIVDWDATLKNDCIFPQGFSPRDLRLHVACSHEKAAPKYIEDNMNETFVSMADMFPPTIHYINMTPATVAVGQTVNFTAKVTDDSSVSSVLIEISGTNYTMAFAGSDIWYYVWNATSAGNYTVVVWANDTLNNWASMSKSFTVYSPALAIALSNYLAAGVDWNVTTLPIYNYSASRNNGSGITGYYVLVEAIGLNADVYVRADGNLISSASYIPLASEKLNYSTMDSTVPSAVKKILTTNFTDNKISNNVTNGTKSWLKFFLDVPSGQAAGNYNNTLEFKAVQTGYAP